MIKKDELYEITVTGTNVQHYKQFYPEIKIGQKIKVFGNEISKSSHLKIKFICDFCGEEYERIVYSEMRSGTINACKKCRTKKTQLTCRQKYGVDHPMQDYMIHKKSVEGHINNFGKPRKDCEFINGVPVSKVQKEICNNLDGFQLNYLLDGYYYDMYNLEKNFVIEYNGKGHNLQVKFGKITQEYFDKREEEKTRRILQRHNLLIIEDPCDHLIHKSYFTKYFPMICQAVEKLNHYSIIQIK